MYDPAPANAHDRAPRGLSQFAGRLELRNPPAPSVGLKRRRATFRAALLHFMLVSGVGFDTDSRSFDWEEAELPEPELALV